MPDRPPESEELILRKRRIFARNLKRAREEANLTQEQLINKTGLTQGYISNLENGRKTVSLDNASLLAAAVGQPLCKLLSSSEEP